MSAYHLFRMVAGSCRYPRRLVLFRLPPKAPAVDLPDRNLIDGAPTGAPTSKPNACNFMY